MALINCRECGSPVSTEAAACPKCGAKAAKKAGCGTALVLLVLLPFGFIFGCTILGAFSGSSSAPPPPSTSSSGSGGLVSASGRIFIGTRLYQAGNPVATVLAVADKDPFTGEKRDMVFVKFDSSDEPEWKTRDTIKSYFQVKE